MTDKFHKAEKRKRGATVRCSAWSRGVVSDSLLQIIMSKVSVSVVELTRVIGVVIRRYGRRIFSIAFPFANSSMSLSR